MMRAIPFLLLVACAPTATRAQPESVLDLQGATLLAFAGDYLFGATGGVLWRLKAGTITPENLPSSSSPVSDLLGDPTGITYAQAPLTDEFTKVKHAAFDGASVVEIASNVQRGSVRQDGEMLYWFDRSQTPAAIMRAKKTGGAVTKLVDCGLTTTPELAVDDTYVYWVDFTAPPTLKRVSKTGGAAENVRENTVPVGLQADGGGLVYMNKDQTTGVTRLLQLPKGGGEPVELAADVDRFFNDASYVYFSTKKMSPQKQSLSRAPKAGKLLDILVDDVRSTASLVFVVGGSTLYWADSSHLNRVGLP